MHGTRLMAFWGTDSCGNIPLRLILAFINSHESSFFSFVDLKNVLYQHTGYTWVCRSSWQSRNVWRIGKNFSPFPLQTPPRPFALTYSVADLPRVRESKTVLDSGFRYWNSDSLWVDLGFRFAIVSGIPDSFGWIPDSTSKNLSDFRIRITSPSYSTVSDSTILSTDFKIKKLL